MTPLVDSGRERAGWWAAVALFTIFGGLVAIRAVVVDRTVGTFIACDGCFYLDVILADLVLCSALASLLLLASCTKSRMLARIPHLLFGIVLLVYTADVLVFAMYQSRLLMTDVAIRTFESGAGLSPVFTGLGAYAGALAVLAALAGLFTLLWWMPGVPTRAFRLTMSFVLASSLAASSYFKGAPFVHDWAIDNVFTANTTTPTRNHYSPERARRVLDREPPQSAWRAEPPPGRGRNVIMILIESWSPWHSSLFGGYENWTPQLDAAARRGMRFTNFHSIGFATEKGLVGSLGGQQIWAPFLHWFETPPYHAMWGLDESLPKTFRGAGYKTAFLGPDRLEPHMKSAWLHDIGFEEVEGRESGAFQAPGDSGNQAPSDRALYERATRWMSDATGPWLLVLETMSTHPPYRDPDTGEPSLEGAISYADREFGKFLERLDGDGFFDSGILVVVSDQRSMTPMTPQELDRWGSAAHSLVPAFIFGEGFEADSAESSVFAQSDLLPSFEWWLTGEVTLEPLEAVMFDPEFEAQKCAFHERGDRRGLVEVICDEGRGQVILDGDHTRFVGRTDLSADLRQKVLRVIARERIEALRRHQAAGDD